MLFAALFERLLPPIVLGAVSSLAAALLRLGFRGLQWCFTHNGISPPVAAASLPAPHRFGWSTKRAHPHCLKR